MNFEDLFLTEVQAPSIVPTEIFENNIRNQKFSYLRRDQAYLLNSWFEKRDNKDTIIQMNTGGGKTVVGLLQLQSSLNEGKGPAVYLCLNNNLVSQTLHNANLLGIDCTEITESNDLPTDFLNSEAILVTTFQKMFNGKSIFGVNGSTSRQPVKVGTILIDDAHAALNIVRNLFTLTFKRNTYNYNLVVNRFKDVLKSQGEGSANDVIDGRDTNGILMVPYWSWLEEVEKLSEEIDKEDTELTFKWSIMRNYLKYSYALVSANSIEITPHCLPLDILPSFSMAERRIYMSATLNDDSALIKDFGVDEAALTRILKPENSKDIGDKLILAPYNINRDFNRDFMIDYLKDKNKVNIVTLVSSSEKGKAWIEKGFISPTSENIDSVIDTLSTKDGMNVVLANRYDGIDLADRACRVLVIDDLPLSSNLNERFSMYVRPDSKLLNIQQAQKIEQGLGRAVRSVNDYSVVFLLGNDLVSKVSTNEFQKNMTPNTVAQIKMGMKVVKSLVNNDDTLIDVMESVVNKVLTRDKGWIQSHKSVISQVEEKKQDESLVKIADLENKAFRLAQSNRYEEASDLILQNINTLLADNILEQGWYFQLAASYLYNIDREKSSQYQIKAHSLNPYLLKPRKGIKYDKIAKKDIVQASNILNLIKRYVEPNSLILHIDNILNNIKFDQKSSNECEEAFKNIGNILGFECQRPEKEFNQGPDVLWNIYNDNYLIIELKNEVKISRRAIYKSETEQISNSYNWFNQKYNDKKGFPILIIPTTKTDQDAFGPPELKIMDERSMNKFKEAVRNLFINLSDDYKDWSEKNISNMLRKYKLDSNQIINFFIDVK